MHYSETFTDAIVYPTWMHLVVIHSGNQHMFKQAFNMFIIIINNNIVAEVEMDKITYLMKKSIRNQLCRCNVPPNHRPACSLISQQCCHPRAGHDSPRNKGTSRITHSQGYTKHSQANTVGFIRPSRSWERLNAKLVGSLQSQEHLHQN